MDILKGKSVRDYNYVCRYKPCFYYYNTQDDKMMYGLTKQLSKDTEFTIHIVQDSDTFDSLAQKYYGRPDLYWVLADFNDVRDPFITLSKKFEKIKIPTLIGIKYK